MQYVLVFMRFNVEHSSLSRREKKQFLLLFAISKIYWQSNWKANYVCIELNGVYSCTKMQYTIWEHFNSFVVFMLESKFFLENTLHVMISKLPLYMFSLCSMCNGKSFLLSYQRIETQYYEQHNIKYSFIRL